MNLVSALCMMMLQYLDAYITIPKIDRQFELYTGQHWLTNAYRKTSVFTPSRNVLTKIKLNLINNSNYVLILDTSSKTKELQPLLLTD